MWWRSLPWLIWQQAQKSSVFYQWYARPLLLDWVQQIQSSNTHAKERKGKNFAQFAYIPLSKAPLTQVAALTSLSKLEPGSSIGSAMVRRLLRKTGVTMANILWTLLALKTPWSWSCHELVVTWVHPIIIWHRIFRVSEGGEIHGPLCWTYNRQM